MSRKILEKKQKTDKMSFPDKMAFPEMPFETAKEFCAIPERFGPGDFSRTSCRNPMTVLAMLGRSRWYYLCNATPNSLGRRPGSNCGLAERTQVDDPSLAVKRFERRQVRSLADHPVGTVLQDQEVMTGGQVKEFMAGLDGHRRP